MQEASDVTEHNNDITLFDYLSVPVKYNRLILRTTFLVFITSLMVSLLLPKKYSTTAMIIPPQQDQAWMGLMMGQMASGMANLAGDLLGKGSPADMYVTILGSTAVSDPVINRFELRKVYDKKYRSDTYKALEKNVDIVAGKKDGIISITVEDKDPVRAAAIANAYVEELNKLVVNLNITGAGLNKLFLENRLEKARSELAKAEAAMKSFQTVSKVVSVSDQTAATIREIAQLKAQLVAYEVQLATLQQQFTEHNQEVKTVKVTIDNLRVQIARLEGQGSVGATPGLGLVPALGERYIRLMREIKIQETLVELLTKQYEMAKFSEAKDVPTVQVIQKAGVPDKKNKPKRLLFILTMTGISFFVSIFIAFLLEYCKQMSVKEREQWRELIGYIKFKSGKYI